MKILILCVLLISTTFTFSDARRPQIDDPELVYNAESEEITTITASTASSNERKEVNNPAVDNGSNIRVEIPVTPVADNGSNIRVEINTPAVDNVSNIRVEIPVTPVADNGSNIRVEINTPAVDNGSNIRVEITTPAPPPTPVVDQITINGIVYTRIVAGALTFLIDLNYIYPSTFGVGGRTRRSLPQAAQNDIYQKVLIGDSVLYRRFVHAHTVLDYENVIFTNNMKAIDIKQLIKVDAVGNEYQRFYTDELDMENNAVPLPEDQQLKIGCPKCVECEKCTDCACEKCKKCVECVPNDTTTPANVTPVPTNDSTTSADVTTVSVNDITLQINETTNKTVTPKNKTTLKPRKTTKYNSRHISNSQPSSVRDEPPRIKPTQKGSKYLKTPMVPIDC